MPQAVSDGAIRRRAGTMQCARSRVLGQRVKGKGEAVTVVTWGTLDWELGRRVASSVELGSFAASLAAE